MMIGKDCWKSNPLLCVSSFCTLEIKNYELKKKSCLTK